MYYDDTGLPWIYPSPNMPTLDTAIVYPGGCLLEGTLSSEGRGTTKPFEIMGGPNLNLQKFTTLLEKQNLPGVSFRPLQFKPTFHKHGGIHCNGVQIHVTNRDTFLPYETGIGFLHALVQSDASFQWRTEMYEFVDDKPAIDLLTGCATVRTMIDNRAPFAEITNTWKKQEAQWAEIRQPFLLY